MKGNAETTYRTGKVNITPANIGLGNVNNTAEANKRVLYATTAGSEVDQTARNNAKLYLLHLVFHLVFFPNTCNQVVYKIGMSVSIAMAFKTLKTVGAGGVIAQLSSEYWPNWNITNLGIISHNSNSPCGISINTSGTIKSVNGMPVDSFELRYTYPARTY